MCTTTEAAKTIRAALKMRGITSRQVSVRSDLYSLGSTIRVTIKDAAVSFDVVKEIAQGHQRVSRCEITGEILGGGNRYVTVDYADGAIDVFAEEVRAAIEAQGEYRRPDAAIRPSCERGYYDVRAGDWEGQCWGVEHAARQVAKKVGTTHVVAAA